MVIGSGEEKFAFGQYRSCLEGGFFVEVRIMRERARMKSPCNAQLRNVFAIDLRGSGVTRTAGIATVGWPAGVSSRLSVALQRT